MRRVVLHRLLSDVCCGIERPKGPQAWQSKNGFDKPELCKNCEGGCRRPPPLGHLPHNTEGRHVLTAVPASDTCPKICIDAYLSKDIGGRWITKTQVVTCPDTHSPYKLQRFDQGSTLRPPSTTGIYLVAFLASMCRRHVSSMGLLMRCAASWPAQASPAPFRDRSCHIPLSIPVRRPSFSHIKPSQLPTRPLPSSPHDIPKEKENRPS